MATTTPTIGKTVVEEAESIGSSFPSMGGAGSATAPGASITVGAITIQIQRTKNKIELSNRTINKWI